MFVVEPDQEFAEYLLAVRASDIAGWQAYLQKYPAAKHVGDAKIRLAGLYAQAGQKALDSYTKTAASSAPDYSSLKLARTFAEQAMAVSPDLPEVKTLDGGVEAALAAIVEKSRNELNAYLAAMKGGAGGYGHLGTAKRLAEIANGIGITKSGNAVLGEVMRAYDAVEDAMRQAESSATARQYDQALTTIDPYRSFAGEEPRIAAIIDADYNYHVEAASAGEDLPNWERRLRNLRKRKRQRARRKSAACWPMRACNGRLPGTRRRRSIAQAQSASYEQQKAHPRPTSCWTSFRTDQRTLVADDLQRLQSAYIQAVRSGRVGFARPMSR